MHYKAPKDLIRSPPLASLSIPGLPWPSLASLAFPGLPGLPWPPWPSLALPGFPWHPWLSISSLAFSGSTGFSYSIPNLFVFQHAPLTCLYQKAMGGPLRPSLSFPGPPWLSPASTAFHILPGLIRFRWLFVFNSRCVCFSTCHFEHVFTRRPWGDL